MGGRGREAGVEKLAPVRRPEIGEHGESRTVRDCAPISDWFSCSSDPAAPLTSPTDYYSVAVLGFW